jgi:multicomponent Na+:H+ antiporter subunit D
LFEFNDFLEIYFRLDKLGILFSFLVSVLWIFTAVYATEYMKHEGKEKRFFAYFSVTLGVTLAIAASGNLITLYVFYEFLTLCTFPLVIHNETGEALQSGKRYLIYSFGGATLVLFGMILLFSLTKSLTFHPGGIVDSVTDDNVITYLVIYLSLFIGFGVKAALVPFHAWLPGAMIAPTPVSALLHAVAVVKSGCFAIFRMSYYLFGVDAIAKTEGQVYMGVLIGITIIMGSFLALHQENLKKRLAYSTISQLGYILLGIVLLNKDAFIGGLLHLINHAVIKIILFFCAGIILCTTHRTEISKLKGLGSRMPITMGCFTIASIALIGIPPTNGFVSKWFLARGGLYVGKILPPVILLVSAVLTALYLLPIITAAFFEKEESDSTYPFQSEQGHQVAKSYWGEVPMKMLFPLVAITAITLILGVFPNPVLDLIGEIAKEIF